MDQIWIAAAAVIAVAVLGVPFAAIVLVSFASRREDNAHTLSRQAPGVAARSARRLLGYRTEQVSRTPGWPSTYSRASRRGRRSGRPGSGSLAFDVEHAPVPVAPAPSPDVRATREVRFGHARRPLSDPGQYAASRQPQPR